MVKLEIDNKPIEVEPNTTVLEAANKLGIIVPHFCYHKKLSIAANCRMCLVQVEKAPKPLPACATPVSDGMKVWTQSELAKDAQNGVMEFLLINHPLDCPICDQGGECQLQDLAVGYGGSSSRFSEKKRVVADKDLGPLVSAEEMARCIHCTRCVRFGQEIAGIMELGMAGRGEHSQIMSFVGKTVDSELSGNMIDVCPVGALTSKPFRYTARSWELERLKSIAPHDSLGSNLNIQVLHDRVVRVVPLANESVNECWISDRDRFSYEGLNSPDRLKVPMMKIGNHWKKISWKEAIDELVNGVSSTNSKGGFQETAFLSAGHSTLEELYLLKKISVGLPGSFFEFRLSQSDFRLSTDGVPWLGIKLSELENIDRALVVGSNIRKENPIIALKLRKASKQGAEISEVSPLDVDFLTPLHTKCVVSPRNMLVVLGRIMNSILRIKEKKLPSNIERLGQTEDSIAIAKSLLGGTNKAILMGNLMEFHSHRSELLFLCGQIASETSASLGFVGGTSNTVGGHLVNTLFEARKSDINEVLKHSRDALIMLNAEGDADFGNTGLALDAMRKSKFVVSISPYDHSAARQYANLILPNCPFTETAGTFVNIEGIPQRFRGVVRPLGESRPAWKILRVLGNLLGLKGFSYQTIDDVQDDLTFLNGDISDRLNNNVSNDFKLEIREQEDKFERIGEVSIYSTDGIVRRSGALQNTRDGGFKGVGMCGSDMKSMGLNSGDLVIVKQGMVEVELPISKDDATAKSSIRLPGGHLECQKLGPLNGPISIKVSKKLSSLPSHEPN